MNKDELILIITDIAGFQLKIASGFVNKLEDFHTFMKNNPVLKFKDLITKEIESKSTKIDKNGAYLEGIYIIFTGFRDKKLEKEIIEAGGVISSSISKKTTYLVCKDLESSSSKIDKAKKDGITVLDLDGIIKVIDEKKINSSPEQIINKNSDPEQIINKNSDPEQIINKNKKKSQNIILSKNLSSSLKDYFVIFTGFRDKDLEKVLIINGGTVAYSMSKYITAVITVDKKWKSSKIKKAKELKIPIYDKDEFEELIKKNIENVLLNNDNVVEKYLNNESNSKENIVIIKTKKNKKSLNIHQNNNKILIENKAKAEKKHILLTNHNKNIENIIEKKQWTLGKKFCKNVDLLVVTKNDPKKKLDEAKKKNIKVLSSNEFKSKYDDDKSTNFKIIKSKKKPNKILLTNDNRDNLKAIAESKGITVGKTFVKSVDLLVISDKDPKKKILKAFEKNIPTIQDSKFIDEYKK